MIDPVKMVVRRLPSPENRRQYITRFDVRSPESTPIALVFDVSDSAPTIDFFTRRIESLLRPFMRSDPVWIYVLSSDTPFDPMPGLTVGQVVDHSVDIPELFSARQIQTRSRRQGSFARPVMTALAARMRKQGVKGLRVLMFTDGALTDFAPISVLREITVIGVVPASHYVRSPHWGRVFPDELIFSLDSSELDAALLPKASAFWGACSLTVKTSTSDCESVMIDTGRARVLPFSEGEGRWNFQDGPAFVRIELSSEDRAPVAVGIKSLRSGESLLLPIDALASDDLSKFAAAEAVLAKSSTGVSIRMALVTNGEPSFWLAVGQAVADAAQRRVAIPHDMALRGLLKDVDAVVCAFVHDTSEMEIYALHREHSPALDWRKGQVVLTNSAIKPMKIWWDGMEGRWFASIGGSEPSELNPTGAQCLADGVFGEHVVLYFSGDLTDMG